MTNFQLKAIIYENKKRERKERLQVIGFILAVLIGMIMAGTGTYPY